MEKEYYYIYPRNILINIQSNDLNNMLIDQRLYCFFYVDLKHSKNITNSYESIIKTLPKYKNKTIENILVLILPYIEIDKSEYDLTTIINYLLKKGFNKVIITYLIDNPISNIKSLMFSSIIENDTFFVVYNKSVNLIEINNTSLKEIVSQIEQISKKSIKEYNKPIVKVTSEVKKEKKQLVGVETKKEENKIKKDINKEKKNDVNVSHQKEAKIELIKTKTEIQIKEKKQIPNQLLKTSKKEINVVNKVIKKDEKIVNLKQKTNNKEKVNIEKKEIKKKVNNIKNIAPIVKKNVYAKKIKKEENKSSNKDSIATLKNMKKTIQEITTTKNNIPEIIDKRAIYEEKIKPGMTFNRPVIMYNEIPEQKQVVTRQEDNITVNISIKGLMGLMYNNVVSVTKNTSLMDLLSMIGIEYKTNENYVTSLNGLKNEGNNGWTYLINGEMVFTNAVETILNNGDSISWEYYVYKENLVNEKEDYIGEMLKMKM